MTLYELGINVAKIREAVDSIEVKGEKNASLIVYAIRKCNEMIEEINRVAAQQSQTNQNGEEQQKEGEAYGEQSDQRAAQQD